MLYILDSGVILRVFNPADPQHIVIRKAVRQLKSIGHTLVLSTQNVAEFWNASTRPATERGGYELPLFLNHFEETDSSPVTPQATAEELLTSLVGKPQAENLLSRYHTLTDLAKASVDELHDVPGIGKSKAAAIKAAFLLAQKLSEEQTPESALLDTPERVADLLREQNRLYDVEHFQVVLVNTRKRLIDIQNVSQGTLDTLLVHPREVFARAITRKAAAIILLHNHPSGDPTPSEADIKVTRDLIRGGQLLKIEVLDHIILGRKTDERPRDFNSLREL
jgi:DNA repair protein RadC